MEKMSYEDFIKYAETSNDVFYEDDRITLTVYCFEGDYGLITIPAKDAYNDFYEFVVNDPVEVEINGCKMLQTRELTIDWVVAQGYEGYLQLM